MTESTIHHHHPHIHLEGHLIVCGWKSDISHILEDILVVNEGLAAEQIVLVNNVDETTIHTLRTDPQFHELHWVKGDFVDPNVLRRAGIAHAAKVMLLAENGASVSEREVDARTVMAMMTIRSMARTIYSCAEIMDRKFQEHLKLAGCDEIILSREYSRFMLVNASSSAGIASVFHELLDVRANFQLRTTPIPEEYVGRTFGELAKHFREQKAVLIGLLENTGNPLMLKREALREAQKTPNISTLVDNLKRVKQISPNRPTINPPLSYPLPAHALAIVVG